MTTGPSVWWATPSDPARYFTAAELAASERYHRPLRRVGLASAISTGGLLIAGAAVALSQAPSEAGLVTIDGRPETVGFLECLSDGSLLLGATMATAALRLPPTLADAWFEYRFCHGRGPDDGFEPVPIGQFLSTAFGLALLVWGGLVIGAAGFACLVSATSWWPLILAGLVVLVAGALPMGAGMIKPRPDVVLRRWDQQQDLEDVMASLGGEAPVLVRRERRNWTPTEHAVNAAASGFGRGQRITVADEFLDEPAPIRRFVLAHELSHLRNRHLLIQLVARTGTAVLAVVAVTQVGLSASVRSAIGVDPLTPVLLPGVVWLVACVAVAMAPISGWIARTHERVADAEALAAAGPLSADLAARLYGQPTGDLNPPRWVRMLAHHPAPAERLEFAARHRRPRNQTAAISD